MKSRLCHTVLLIAMVLFAMSCASVNNISVSNVNNSDALPDGSFLYALPQTILDINVTAEEISIVPGPFAKYAQKYLGIQHAPSKAEKIYSLKKVNIRKHHEADPDFIYTVSGITDPSQYANLTNLLKDSLILTATHFSGNQMNAYTFPAQSGDLLYTDLSVKRNFEAEKDVEISMVLPDTNYNVRPARRTVLKEKTPEQKAEEAANFLIKLKKRRFKLVAGQYEYMPNGESMAAALQELARIEEEYLALFIGRRVVSEIRRTYHYTPEAGKSSDRVVLFRFAPNSGFIDARETDGIPVMLELQAMHKTRELEGRKLPVKPGINTIPYRIADQVNMKLLAGEQVWAEAIYPVFQYGVPVTMHVGN
jgi:hypothetical protein